MWMKEVTTGMREKGINNMEWVDREERRWKIKLQARKYVQISILCTLKNNILKNNNCCKRWIVLNIFYFKAGLQFREKQ